MTGTEALTLVLVLSAPVTLALVVAMLRGYTIDLHLTRENKRPTWRHRDQGEADDFTPGQ